MKSTKNSSKLFFIDENDTECPQYNYNSNHPLSYNTKKTFTTFPIKTFLEDPEIEQPFSKMSLTNTITNLNKTPRPKHLEMPSVPSKLRLKAKGFKDLKVNQQNQILIKTNTYFISCPNSEDTESETEYARRSRVKGMKKMRKRMACIKKTNIPKILSKNDFVKKVDNEEEDIYSGEEQNDFVLQSFELDSNGNYINNNEQLNCSNKKNGNNSCSILRILENNQS